MRDFKNPWELHERLNAVLWSMISTLGESYSLLNEAPEAVKNVLNKISEGTLPLEQEIQAAEAAMEATWIEIQDEEALQPEHPEID